MTIGRPLFVRAGFEPPIRKEVGDLSQLPLRTPLMQKTKQLSLLSVRPIAAAIISKTRNISFSPKLKDHVRYKLSVI